MWIHVYWAEVVCSVMTERSCVCACSCSRWESVTRKAVNMKGTEITHACCGHRKTCSLKGMTRVTHNPTCLCENASRMHTCLLVLRTPLCLLGCIPPHPFYLFLSASFSDFTSLWPPSPSHSFFCTDIFWLGCTHSLWHLCLCASLSVCPPLLLEEVNVYTHTHTHLYL